MNQYAHQIYILSTIKVAAPLIMVCVSTVLVLPFEGFWRLSDRARACCACSRYGIGIWVYDFCPELNGSERPYLPYAFTLIESCLIMVE